MATAPSQIAAEMWVELLRSSGIDARLDPHDEVSFLGTFSRACRVLVPEAEVSRARALLDSLGSDDVSADC